MSTERTMFVAVYGLSALAGASFFGVDLVAAAILTIQGAIGGVLFVKLGENDQRYAATLRHRDEQRMRRRSHEFDPMLTDGGMALDTCSVCGGRERLKAHAVQLHAPS